MKVQIIAFGDARTFCVALCRVFGKVKKVMVPCGWNSKYNIQSTLLRNCGDPQQKASKSEKKIHIQFVLAGKKITSILHLLQNFPAFFPCSF